MIRVLILLGCLALGYLFGSIPNGVIIGKCFYGIDPRNAGSKNTGGTNVARTVSKKAGLITIFLDILKMIIPVYIVFSIFTYCSEAKTFMLGENQNENAFGIGNTLSELTYYLTALGCMVGHAYSIFLKFKGGKIVSTYGGASICFFWPALPLFGGIMFTIVKKTKMVSLASIITSIIIAIYSWIVYLLYAFGLSQVANWFTYFGCGPHISIYLPILMTLGCALLIFRHRTNIKRIIAHEENKTYL